MQIFAGEARPRCGGEEKAEEAVGEEEGKTEGAVGEEEVDRAGVDKGDERSDRYNKGGVRPHGRAGIMQFSYLKLYRWHVLSWAVLAAGLVAAYMVGRVVGVHRDPFTGKAKLLLVND